MNDKLNNNITILPPFKRFCMTIGELPTSYVDSMTYYESLVWLCNYLSQTVIPAINNNGEAVTELQEKYIELKNYVDNYFENLDVQDEINNKLDEMAQSGELAEIIDAYLQMACVRGFDSLSSLLDDDILSANTIVSIAGYYTPGDGGDSLYYIREKGVSEIANNITTYETTGNLIAQICDNSNEIYAKKYGVKCDKFSDDTSRLQTIINYCKDNNKVLVLDGYAYVGSTIQTKGIKIKGIGIPAEATYTYTSSEYGYIGWDYLRNVNHGADITFDDYCNDVLTHGSGIISDTASPIIACHHSDGKFNLENVCICGWIRTANQDGVKSTYDGNESYINGKHKFKNVNVINCGGSGIHLNSFEQQQIENLKCLFNFGYGLYIEGLEGIDTPFEYMNFVNCIFDGNKLGGVYAKNCFRKQVKFTNCNFNAC